MLRLYAAIHQVFLAYSLQKIYDIGVLCITAKIPELYIEDAAKRQNLYYEYSSHRFYE